MAADVPSGWDAGAAVAACDVRPWSGVVWRYHGRRYAADDAAGSLKATGRFGQGIDRYPASDTWPVLYTSLDPHVALAERVRHTTVANLEALVNQRLSRLRVVLVLRRALAACGNADHGDLRA